MSSSVSCLARPFGDLPVQRRGGRWLLTAGSGTAPADRALAAELDRFAVAMAAADHAVAALPPLPSHPWGRR
ncbi:hypothetical protein [Actinacidiphila guanduensis]|uniref:Uncharacterized protein n=1 Tax=Actinacidiphila guanduensis TaxID=310781 RepID=A0A1H0SGA9_9ACTN|nr:hypothetical protein [Actinacidiphila guanduensis]SDP40822.1 hypothetical protein SAMN05216259_12813 [Actinacidiphila guanduensis]